jgi:Spy/CpxP family protein refolding chaperone
MRKVLAIALAASLLSAGLAAALQPPGGFGFGMGRGGQAMLLRAEAVQKELKLTDDQKAKLEDFFAGMMERFQELRDLDPEERREKIQEIQKENDKTIAGILKPEQVKRLKEIGYQQAGAMALNDPEVIKALGITDEQRDQVRELNRNMMEEMRELIQPGQPPDEEARNKMQELRKGVGEKMMKILTEEQKKKWKDMQGEPFKGEIRFGRPPV